MNYRGSERRKQCPSCLDWFWPLGYANHRRACIRRARRTLANQSNEADETEVVG